MKFLNHIDLNKAELRNAAIQVLGTAPSSPVLGQTYFDSATLQILTWNGSAWINKATDSLLLQGANGAYYLARGNHTGTQALSTVTISSGKLAGRTSGATGVLEEISVGTGLSFASQTIALADMAANTLKGNNTASTGPSADLTVTQVRNLLLINNVDNTSDLNKPVSNATQTALNAKQDASANLSALSALNSAVGLLEQTGTNTFSKRYIGIANSTDIGTRADYDGRFAPLAHVGSGGTAHANVVAGGAAGFMTGSDKTKLDGIATGATANQSDGYLLSRANHTGTQTSSTISDFATTVQATRLDQFAAPTNPVSLNSQRITSLADPVNPTDAATRQFVLQSLSSAAAGIDSKPSVRVVATTNITLSGTQTIDGISLVAGDRVLLTGQTTGSQNGVYVVASGAWSRATDADENGEITPGAFWYVEEGTTNQKTQWRASNTGTITLGTTNISILQFGAAVTYTASNGIVLSGNNFSAQVVASGGILTGASGLYVDTTIVARKFSATIGDGSATSIAVTHNLGTKDVQVTVRDASTDAVVYPDWVATSTTTVTFAFASAPASSAYRASIVG